MKKMARHSRRRQGGGALVLALMVFGALGGAVGLVTAYNIQQARSARIAQSREALDKAMVKLAGLTSTTAANPAAPAVTAGTGAPVGGGFLPVGVTPATDAFASPLGYCVGNPSVANDPVYAVISAGPDKAFQTTCTQALAGVHGRDDQVARLTVSQLYSGFSAVSYHGATVQLESQLGSILAPRAGEIRAVNQTGAVYLNPDGTVGNWQPLTGAAAVVGLVQNVAGERVWSDGSYGTTCKEYRYPGGLKVYRGAVGDGIYRLQPGGPGAATYPVYCDQSTDGGGWSLVFAGDNSTAGHDVPVSAVTTGLSLVTYTTNPGAMPVLPNGLSNNAFTQGLFKDGGSTWQSLYGSWVHFSFFTASLGNVSTTYTGVASASGRTSMWLTEVGWGWATDPTTADLTLWDAGGISPTCGGANVGYPKLCPSFNSSETTYQYHWDTTSYRELYVR